MYNNIRILPRYQMCVYTELPSPLIIPESNIPVGPWSGLPDVTVCGIFFRH